MELWVAKVISIVITFALPLTCILITWPMAGYIQSKGTRGERIICYLMCFGGGIFFGTFMLHIGPECRDILDEYLLHPNEIVYPVTDLIIGCGFLFTLLMEKAVMRVQKRRNQAKKRRQQQQKDSELTGSVNSAFQQRRRESDPDCTANCESCSVGKQCESLADDLKISMAVTSSTNSLQNLIEPSKSDVDLHTHLPETEGSVPKDIGPTSDNLAPSSASSSVSNIDKHAHHHDDDEDDEVDNHHTTRSLILILALSLHHLFEGLSLGLQFTVSRVFTLLLALMCHETIISFSLGLQFIKCHYTLRRFLITAIVSCIVTPVGVAIGTIITETGDDGVDIEIVSGVLQSFAAGTFIFVTFFEILQEEIDPHDTSIGKVVSVAAGYTVIALLMLVPEETGESHPEMNDLTTVNTTMSSMTVGILFNR